MAKLRDSAGREISLVHADEESIASISITKAGIVQELGGNHGEMENKLNWPYIPSTRIMFENSM